MKKLTEEDIKHTAFLARIKLTDPEVTKFQKELNSILEYVEILNEIDVSDVTETSQVSGLKNKSDEDEAENGLSQGTALSNSKSKKNGYFLVKK